VYVVNLVVLRRKDTSTRLKEGIAESAAGLARRHPGLVSPLLAAYRAK